MAARDPFPAVREQAADALEALRAKRRRAANRKSGRAPESLNTTRADNRQPAGKVQGL